ncbi:permease-like cell division protein FtsX [Salinispora cortesiana]|uniref:permease-like cell division protein FtsX n=1 Tax=Salinispora cortesiana TaxID=1305843 RepID=UPI0004010324|nr:permease-like cell division protein FtsX [Salinispora cortesiana]
MRLKYVLSEVMVGLWRNVTMTIAMIITMAVSLTMLGASGLIYVKVAEMKELYFENIEVSIFLETEVTEEQKTAVQAKLDADPLIESVTYVNKEEAHEIFEELFRDSPDLLSAIGPEALPESYRLTLVNPQEYEAIGEQYAEIEGVDQVVDKSAVLDKIFNLFSAGQKIALVAAVAMAAAALLLVANTIQVAAYSKRREVAVMKLVGASNWFIQAPFVLEAVVAGLIGSLLGLGALAGLKVFLFDGALSALQGLFAPVTWGEVLLAFPLMAAVGGLISAITAWVTLHFYLRV